MTTEENAAKIRHENQKEANDIIDVLKTDAGKRFVWRLLHEFCKVNHDIGGEDAEVRRRLGQRSVGLNLMIEIEEAGPELYLDMALFNMNEKMKENL